MRRAENVAFKRIFIVPFSCCLEGSVKDCSVLSAIVPGLSPTRK
jgi:hypothetical protein